MQLLDTVAKKTILAAVQEQLLEKFKKGVHKSGTSWKGSVPYENDDNTGFSPSKMWKAKQLKEYHRTNGLCYKCGEKFIPRHKCTVPSPDANIAQLAAVMESESGHGGGILPDEMLEALE
jgi:hypothetical protein